VDFGGFIFILIIVDVIPHDSWFKFADLFTINANAREEAGSSGFTAKTV
jgi:hypothetical protein